MQTRGKYFYRENMTSYLHYVTATLRTFYAWRGWNYILINSSFNWNIGYIKKLYCNTLKFPKSQTNNGKGNVYHVYHGQYEGCFSL